MSKVYASLIKSWMAGPSPAMTIGKERRLTFCAGQFQDPRLGHGQPSHVDAVRQHCAVGLVMMPVHDQSRRRDLGQSVDHRETMAMR